ncbi:hypothetical protein GCM10007880_24110 [Mesorhizobium amorphae]|nr:hypothetical protein GCM10007880_24110 [Mesorhizobium amorphae]
MGAERYFGRRFGLIEADTGFEPLPLDIYQGDQRDRSMHDGRGKAADAIEVRISCRIERIEAMEDGKPVRCGYGVEDFGRQSRCFFNPVVHRAPKYPGLWSQAAMPSDAAARGTFVARNRYPTMLCQSRPPAQNHGGADHENHP